MMNVKSLIAAAVAAAFALPLAAYAEGDKASSATSGGSSAAASSSGGGQATAGATAGAEQMFKDLDKNKDGFISREEAKGSPHEKEFDKLDKNGDGKLSREEHAAAHKAQASTGGTKSDSGSAEPQPSTPAAPTGEKKY